MCGQNWKGFAVQLPAATGAKSSRIRDALDEIPNGGRDPEWDEIFVEWGDQERDKAGAEVHADLSNLATGDAMTVLRGKLRGNGWK